MSLTIIGGTARGRKLSSLPGEITRPTTAKVRAALFNILVAWTPDNRWLDLFGGSGAIGLEAASRGAARVVVVEKDPRALAVIRANVASTKLTVEVRSQAAGGAVRDLAGQAFDVVFLDPPYSHDPVPVMQAVVEGGLLAPDGRLVVEHRADRPMPEAIGTWTRRDTRTYAESALTFYAEGGPETGPEPGRDAEGGPGAEAG